MARILVVDDRPIDREFLVTLLGYGGHRLFEAADGAEALAIASAERPDLIVSDILMPTMDGYEFARRLRADPDIAGIPMIFYTANFREREARTLAQSCGVSRVLAKPAAPETILETVQAMLGLPAGGPPLPAELSPPPAGHLGGLNEHLAEYGEALESASRLMATVDDRRRELTEERERVQEIAGKLSQTVDHLQAISLRLTLLVEMGIELSAERDPARLLETFCRCAHELCVAKYAVAARVEGASLRRLAVRGIDAAALGDFVVPPAASVLGLALAERRPRRWPDLAAPAAERAVLGLPAAHPPLASFLAVPIVSAQRSYGWLYLADKLGGGEFSDIDEQMAMTLATQAAVNYENLDAYAALEREAAERQAAQEALRRTLRARTVMAECNHALIHSGDEAGLLAAMCRGVVTAGGYRMAWIGLALDDADQTLRPAAHAGHEAGYLKLFGMSWSADGQLPAAVAVRSGRPYIVADVTRDPVCARWRAAALERGYRSAAALPLLDAGRSLGALTIVAAEPEAFDAEQVALFEELAGDIAYGIVNLRTRQARQEAETALGDSRQRLAGILESAMDAIISIDAERRIVLFNAAAEAMFGCPADEALGTSLDRFIPTRFRAAHAGHIRRFGENGATRRAMGHLRDLSDLSGLRSDGSEFPIEASISQIEVGGEKLYTVILRDIGERVRAEAEIRRLNADLERRIEERTAELAHANEALLKSNQELQRFAYVAAHDLQTPLRSIAGFTQLLRRDLQGSLDERAGEWIEQVVGNTARMQTLIQDLLAYSRLDSQARPYEPTDFRRLFDEVLSTLAIPIGETGAEVTCGDLPTLAADRTQVAQVLQNLVENGVKYNTARPPRVHVSAERQGGEWVFSVADNGIGVDPKYHERIFEVFRRLHTQQDYPGTGIGLAICRRIVERHGGRIWIESGAGTGSAFRFTLPADSYSEPVKKP